jgi:Arc/MetJ-type ribon-helix-helix transcriptional regulator
MNTKQRLSASVDASVLEAADTAVSEGRAANVSAWVNDALRRQAEHDQRMRALDAFLGSYEAKHGVISDEELREATRAARERALVVRGKKPASSPRKPRRRGASAA